MARTEKAISLQTEISTSEVTKRMHMLRGCQVMLDRDLAEIYEVETRVLKRQVRNNIDRFPGDFVFTPTEDELETLRSKFRILKSEDGSVETGVSSFATMAFTELGVAMLSSVLHSKKAAHVNIGIMRVFVQLRQGRSSQQHDLMPKLESMESMFKQRFDELQAQFQKQLLGIQPVAAHAPLSVIQSAVARHWGLTAEDLKSAARAQAISLPSHVAIYLVRKHLGMGFSEIGYHFGRRDHATVIHAYHKIQSVCEHTPLIRTAVDILGKEIQQNLA